MVAGKKFQVTVQGEKHWLIVHRGLSSPAYVVTHYKSSKLLAEIDNATVSACLGNSLDAAKLTFKKLVEKHGESRLRSVLAGA